MAAGDAAEQRRLVADAVHCRLVTKDSVLGTEPSVKTTALHMMKLIKAAYAGDAAACSAFQHTLQAEMGRYVRRLHRVKQVRHTCAEELQRYAALEDDLEVKIAAAQGDVETLKVLLQEEKLKRQHRAECEVMSKKINDFPDPATSEAAIAALREDMKRLEGESQRTDDKLEERRKQFKLLLHSIFELQSAIREDNTIATAADVGNNEDDADADDTVEMADVPGAEYKTESAATLSPPGEIPGTPSTLRASAEPFVPTPGK